jgi:hypothetical protein
VVGARGISSWFFFALLLRNFLLGAITAERRSKEKGEEETCCVWKEKCRTLRKEPRRVGSRCLLVPAESQASRGRCDQAGLKDNEKALLSAQKDLSSRKRPYWTMVVLNTSSPFTTHVARRFSLANLVRAYVPIHLMAYWRFTSVADRSVNQ